MISCSSGLLEPITSSMMGATGSAKKGKFSTLDGNKEEKLSSNLLITDSTTALVEAAQTTGSLLRKV
jgi:hypothetical protein